MDGWAKTKAAAKYAGISERTLRDWLKEGLKHSRLPSGMVLIEYRAVDEFLRRFTDNVEASTDRVVEEVLGGLR